MKKVLKLALLSSASVLTLAACGDDTTQETTEPQTEEQATDTTESPDDTATEESTESTDDTSEDQSYDQADDQSGDQSGDQTENTDTPGIESMDFAVSLQDAADAFREQVGDDAVEITEVNFDDEDGTYIYEFQGYSNGTEYEADIDAETGDVVDSDSESDEELDDDVLDLDNVVEPSEAMSAALESAGQGYVTDWELDVENGTAVYDIDIENSNDVKVNAETGEVF